MQQQHRRPVGGTGLHDVQRHVADVDARRLERQAELAARDLHRVEARLAAGMVADHDERGAETETEDEDAAETHGRGDYGVPLAPPSTGSIVATNAERVSIM